MRRACAAACIALAWGIGVSAALGLLWLGSLAPAYLADTFHIWLPPPWVQAARSESAQLLGAAVACAWLLWSQREGAQCAAARRYRRWTSLGFLDNSDEASVDKSGRPAGVHGTRG